jgi:uncharacterized protein YciI
LLYAVLLHEIEQIAELGSKHGKAREDFLLSLKERGQLLLEGSFGERGSLILLEAESFNDVLSMLQKDPYVTEPTSSSVQMQSLKINVVGNTKLLVKASADVKTPRARSSSEQESEICPLKGQ